MRTISALVFAAIVVVEIVFFLQAKPVYQTIPGERIGESHFSSSPKTIIDYNAQKDTNTKYAVIIGATILIGGVVTFSIPAGRRKANAIDSDLD
jgi:hypothetical protein